MPRLTRYLSIIALPALLGVAIPAPALEGLVLVVQPVLDPAQTIKAYQPLCDYLARYTGQPCRVLTRPNFYAHWETMRKGDSEYNLAVDAAHFTDYRVQKQRWQVLAKIPDSVSYSLITRDNAGILDPAELTGRRIATFGIPSIGAARLQGMFPNPVRQPIAVEVANAEEGMAQLLSGKVFAAILPTPIVSREMNAGAPITVVLTTEPIPHIALSASPALEAPVREKIRQLVLAAHQGEDGRRMLAAIGFERFDPATAALYAGQGRILKDYWGY